MNTEYRNYPGYRKNTELLQRLEAALAADKFSQKDRGFAFDLFVKGAKFGLSEKQLYWANKLADRAEGKESKPAGREVTLGNFDRLVELFKHAQEHLKYPKIRFVLASGAEVTLSLCGSRSKYEGQINVASGRYGEPDAKWYGRINHQGVLVTGRDYTDEVSDCITEFAKDPAGYAAKYGHLTGSCCFCNRALEDERSTAVGYGPVCAKNYGLAWGKIDQERQLERFDREEPAESVHAVGLVFQPTLPSWSRPSDGVDAADKYYSRQLGY